MQQNPSEAELEEWIDRSGLAVNRFFNTSGLRYKALNLKEKVRTAPREELIRVLSTDGMLVKRPLLIASEKTGKTYDATVVLADDGQYANFKLEFDQQKGGKR